MHVPVYMYASETFRTKALLIKQISRKKILIHVQNFKFSVPNSLNYFFSIFKVLKFKKIICVK